tara:strand:+ start:431 stop:1000 length:570 start_codon:yes stop_codon:yes gene_type:complete
MPNLTEKEAASIVTEQSDGTDIARNDYVLGSQITAETLNVEEGPNKGQSVALWLAGSPAGQALLSHGNPSLRSQIDTETLNQVIDTEILNQVIEEGKYKGTSVAECPAEWSAPETHEVSANAAAEDDEASRSPSRNHAETPLERLVVMSKEIPKEVVSSPPRENTGEASEIPGAQNNDVESVSIHNFGF